MRTVHLRKLLFRNIPPRVHREILREAKRNKITASAVLLTAVDSYFLQKSLQEHKEAK